MKSDHLILGATGAIGYAYVKALLAQKIPSTLLVRDSVAAVKVFGHQPLLEIAEGDVLDVDVLTSVARGKRFIFHGVNASYEHWQHFMPVATRRIIDAASLSGATVIFPGNTYNFGLTRKPISESTPFRPNSRLGSVRVQIENQLKAASDLGRIKVLIVRLPEIWGPGVTNRTFAPMFENVSTGKPLRWLFTTTVPQQMAYNMDAGRAMVELMQRSGRSQFETYNYAGNTVITPRVFLDRISEVAGKPLRVRVLSKKSVSLFGVVAGIYWAPGLRTLSRKAIAAFSRRPVHWHSLAASRRGMFSGGDRVRQNGVGCRHA